MLGTYFFQCVVADPSTVEPEMCPVGRGLVLAECIDEDNDGVCVELDCNDNDPTVNSPIVCDYNGSVCGDVELCVAECPTPPTEVCDNQDNDCDDEVDEGLICNPLYDLAIDKVLTSAQTVQPG